MIARRNGHVALLLASSAEETLWQGAFASQGIESEPVPLTDDLEYLAGDARMAGARAALLDTPLLALNGHTPLGAATFLRARFPGMALFVRLPERTGISPAEQEWARRVGIASLLPGSSAAAWQDSLAPVLGRMLEVLGGAPIDVARLEAWINETLRTGAEPRPGPIKDAYMDAYHLERNGVTVARLVEAMQAPGGVPVADRTWHGKPYRACFVASEAIDWLIVRYGLNRPLAAKACEFLWRTGRIHHVLRQAAFADDHLYFRFSGRRTDLDRVDLGLAAAGMRGKDGVAIAERTYLAKSYPRCFVGDDAARWLMDRYGLPLGAAETIGQRLLELGVFHHVVDEHGFVESKFFYRFRADEETIPA
jgi:hypothetical protein